MPGGQDEGGSPAVEVGELVLRHPAANFGTPRSKRRGQLGVLLRADDDERQADGTSRRERGQRILALLNRTDEEQVVARGTLAGPERGVDARRRAARPP
jgi:hypothetical protein